MRTTLSRSPLALLLFVATLAACDDEGVKGVSTADLTISPARFTFSRVAIGQDEDRSITVRNTGQGTLVINRIDGSFGSNEEFTLYYQGPGDPEQLTAIRSTGEVVFPTNYTLEPEEALELTLNYAPSSEDVPTGSLTLFTNVSGQREVSIPVETTGTGGEIVVRPSTLDFGRVPAGDVAWLESRVSNVGSADLEITGMRIDGSADFTATINGADPNRRPDVLDDPDGDGNPGVASEQGFGIRVKYSPLTDGPDRAELTLETSDPNQREVRINLVANGATPCLTVTPAALEFRTSLVNRTDTRPLEITSCGSEPIEISQIFVSEDSDSAFELDVESVPGLPVVLPAAVENQPQPSRQIRVNFSPREQRVYNGKLVIVTDPPTESREISLLGRGVANACPQARAAQTEFFQKPLDFVRLDGTPSLDPDGPDNRPIRYEWIITSRPDGSLSQPVESFFNAADPAAGGPEDDTTSPTSLLFLDQPGIYTAELRVTDNLGLDSVQCDNAAIVFIEAKPEEAIAVQLTWENEGDPDPLDDQGADLDLHLLHPLATNWFDSPLDCFYENPVPDWGELGTSEDDPILDVDDINGGGPENARLNNPQNTEVLQKPYLVGVHYYRATDRITGASFGPARATVRIFIKGELAWDFTADDGPGFRDMMDEDHFWDVAQIHWPSGDVVTRDIYSEQRP